MSDELKVVKCEVCGIPVIVLENSDAPALCILHYFNEDVSEEWESE